MKKKAFIISGFMISCALSPGQMNHVDKLDF